MNTTSTDEAITALATTLGVSPTVALYLGIGSSSLVGLAVVFKCFAYLRRFLAGKDLVSECIVGRSVVHIEVDTNGDGKIESSKKLVVNANTRQVEVQDTGLPSPDPGATPPPAAAVSGLSRPGIVTRTRAASLDAAATSMGEPIPVLTPAMRRRTSPVLPVVPEQAAVEPTFCAADDKRRLSF